MPSQPADNANRCACSHSRIDHGAATVDTTASCCKCGCWGFEPASAVTRDDIALHFTTIDLVRMLGESSAAAVNDKPWGIEHELSVPALNFTVKQLTVQRDARTSLQVHEGKHEVIFIFRSSAAAENDGFVEVAPAIGMELQRCVSDVIYIPPGAVHRVTGPLSYLEVSTYAPDDVVRLSDDYGRS